STRNAALKVSAGGLTPCFHLAQPLNLRLGQNNMTYGNPVRVIRGPDGNDAWCPRQGYIQV
ncbi:unnamed protein product, partial [Mycena citricolor]